MSPLERKSAPAARRLALAADLAYDSIALAHALQAQLPTFTQEQRHDTAFQHTVTWAFAFAERLGDV